MRVPALVARSFFLTLAVPFVAAPPRAQCTTAFEPGFEQLQAVNPVGGTAVADFGAGAGLYVFDRPVQTTFEVEVWNWDGSTRRNLTTLGPFGLSGTPVVNDILTFDDGNSTQLFIGGLFVGSGSARNVMRWNGTSFLPATLGDEWDIGVSDLCIHDDGSGAAVYAGGSFLSAPTVARWNGTSWAQVGTNLSGHTFSLASYDDGNGAKLYASGLYTIGNGVVRLDGTTWTFLTSVGGKITSFEVADLGSGPRLFAGGPLSSIGGVGVWRVVAYDGSTWSQLGAGIGGGNVWKLRSFVDGGQTKLAVGGAFTSAGGIPAPNCALWDGTTWSALGSGTSGTVYALDVFDTGGGPRLVAGGDFQTAGGVATSALAQWTGSAWARLTDGLGADSGINKIVRHTDAGGPALFAGGTFKRVGSTPANSVARFDGTQWSALGSGLSGYSYSAITTVTTVLALASFDDGGGPGLFVGGNFATAGGVPARAIAVWRNGSWSDVGGSLVGGGEVRALGVHDDGSGPALYAGGNFTNMGGVTTVGLARWNGTSWTAINAAVAPTFDCKSTLAFAVFDEGLGGGPQLILGGYFPTIGMSQIAYPMLRWDGSTLIPMSGLNSVGGNSAIVRSLTLFDDGSGSKLYIGGRFDSASGVPVNNVASWNGAQYAPVGAGFPPTLNLKWTVLALESFDAGAGSGAQLYAGGIMHLSNGVTYNGLARFDGATWQPISGGLGPPNGTAVSLAAFDDGSSAGTALYVGGGFQSAGGVGSANIARLRSNCPDPRSFCAGDGSASACPCGNASASGHGCPTSFDANGAQLSASGIPSVAADSMALTADGVSFSVVSFFQGTGRFNGGAGAVLGDGLFCTGGTLVRLGPIYAPVGTAVFPAAGGAALSAQGFVPASGGTRTYQVWFRDSFPFCTSATFNTTNGVEITYVP